MLINRLGFPRALLAVHLGRASYALFHVEHWWQAILQLIDNPSML